MARPPHCAPEVYEIMRACWDHNPVGRPIFDDMCDRLDSLCMSKMVSCTREQARIVCILYAHYWSMRDNVLPLECSWLTELWWQWVLAIRWTGNSPLTSLYSYAQDDLPSGCLMQSSMARWLTRFFSVHLIILPSWNWPTHFHQLWQSSSSNFYKLLSFFIPFPPIYLYPLHCV